jgi:penicillin amidase
MEKVMRKSIRNFLKRLGLITIFVVFLVIAVGYLWVKISIPRSFPTVDGEVQIPGLTNPVNIYRDEMGIPNIYATSSHDLFLAQGYVHAQDRFWQMDFWRHIGSARLSEMFPSEIETDVFLRTLGWRQLAEKEYDLLEPEIKSMLEAYSEGVNAYLNDHK